MASVPVIGLVCRQADFRHIFMVLAAKRLQANPSWWNRGSILAAVSSLARTEIHMWAGCACMVGTRVPRMWLQSGSGRLCLKIVAMAAIGPHLRVGDFAGRHAVRGSLAFGLRVRR